MVDRSSSVGFIGIGGLWCGGSGRFRGGGCGCCLVGRVSVGWLIFFFFVVVVVATTVVVVCVVVMVVYCSRYIILL